MKALLITSLIFLGIESQAEQTKVLKLKADAVDYALVYNKDEALYGLIRERYEVKNEDGRDKLELDARYITYVDDHGQPLYDQDGVPELEIEWKGKSGCLGGKKKFALRRYPTKTDLTIVYDIQKGKVVFSESGDLILTSTYTEKSELLLESRKPLSGGKCAYLLPGTITFQRID